MKGVYFLKTTKNNFDIIQKYFYQKGIEWFDFDNLNRNFKEYPFDSKSYILIINISGKSIYLPNYIDDTSDCVLKNKKMIRIGDKYFKHDKVDLYKSDEMDLILESCKFDLL